MKKLLIWALALSLTACSMLRKDDDQATAVAVEWAEAFFNCDYHAAEALCTPESRRWLQFAASNTTQHDLDMLRQQAAQVEATEFFPEASDTLRVVELVVRNSVSPTIHGGESAQVEEALFHVTVVKRNGSWKVRMASLPRSEKQSRD
jgi:ketosteroid isomerase-like protein